MQIRRKLFKFLASSVVHCILSDRAVVVTFMDQMLTNEATVLQSQWSPCNQEEADTRLLLHASNCGLHGTGRGVLPYKGTWGCAALEGMLFGNCGLTKGIIFGNGAATLLYLVALESRNFILNIFKGNLWKEYMSLWILCLKTKNLERICLAKGCIVW